MVQRGWRGCTGGVPVVEAFGSRGHGRAPRPHLAFAWFPSHLHMSSCFSYCSLRPPTPSLPTLPPAHSDGEVYSWNKVTTSINNLILGKIYIDHGGIMKVKGGPKVEGWGRAGPPTASVPFSGVFSSAPCSFASQPAQLTLVL